VSMDTLLRVEGGRFPICLRAWADASVQDGTDRMPRPTSDDVAALGRLAYQALAGEAPDGASTAVRCPGAPAELTALIDRMLAREVGAAEVHDCAGWLAATVELIPAKPRWTPVHGVGPEKVPVAADAFQIRISRTPTR